MPHVTVYLYLGHTEEEKQRVSEKIRDAVMEELKVNASAVSVGVQEVVPEDWKEKVYKPQMYTEKTRLYIEPGYHMD